MEWTTNMEGGGTLYFRDDGSYFYFEARRPYEKSDPETAYQVILQGVHGGQLLGKLTPWEGGWKLSQMVSRSTLEKWGCLPVNKVICQKSYGWRQEGNLEVSQLERSLDREVDVKEKDLHMCEVKSATSSNKKETQERWEKVEEEKISGSQLVIGEEETLILEKEREMIEIIPEKQEQWVVMEENRVILDGFHLCSQPWTLVENQEIASLLHHYKQVYLRENGKSFTLAIPYFSDKEFPLTSLFSISSVERVEEKHFVLFSFTKEGKPVINPLA